MTEISMGGSDKNNGGPATHLCKMTNTSWDGNCRIAGVQVGHGDTVLTLCLFTRAPCPESTLRFDLAGRMNVETASLGALLIGKLDSFVVPVCLGYMSSLWCG